jgi:5'-3' exoribonuclease 2
VIGEGEHKILDFIRAQQTHVGLSGDARGHVIYGDDADLIFLGLATHLSNLIVLKNWTTNPAGE